MADYYPLLARALDALPDRSPGLRRAVYDRARNALVSQLRSLEPPLSEDDIDLERRALDTAIERLEVEHGGIPAPANDAAVKKAQAAPPPPPPEPPSPVRAPEQAPSPEPTPAPLAEAVPEAAPPALPEPEPTSSEGPPPPVAELPRAPSPRFNLKPEPAETRPREAAIAITAPKTQPDPEIALLDTLGMSGDARAATKPNAGEPVAGSDIARGDAAPGDTASEDANSGDPAQGDPSQGRQRPRIAVVAPRRRSRILRNLAIGIMLVGVIGVIAVAAFLLRDTPQALVRVEPNATQASPQDGAAEAKFGDRVGSDPAPTPPVERAKPKVEETPVRPAPPVTEAKPSVAVAQQAILIEESTAPDSTQPVTSPGRATWRVDTANGDQGQDLQTVAVATVTYPNAGLSLTMTIRKNLDATLPASHTVSLAFSQTGADAASRTVQDVGLLQAKDDENGRGSPVSGLPVRVRDNLFLIGLSSLPADVERNADLLLHRNWFDLAVRYTTGRRAVLTFEKGQSGTQVLQQAFDAWK
ncbi:MAG: histidine kinase [Parafilimonas terrae]|nr:histidine kinase [Parafilimonas terrae]